MQSPRAPRQVLELDLRRVLRRRHHRASDIAHMLARIGELAAQKLRLDAHGLLQIGGMNQLPRMLERGPHVLFGEGERLLGDFRARRRAPTIIDLLAASKNIPNAFSACSMVFSASSRNSAGTSSFGSDHGAALRYLAGQLNTFVSAASFRMSLRFATRLTRRSGTRPRDPRLRRRQTGPPSRPPDRPSPRKPG